MANARELKKRIKTVSSTKKITRTMEMVATAKSKKAYDRIHALMPYANKLSELMGDLSQAGDMGHPLLRRVDEVNHITFVVITSNRGLCGGFNANLLRAFVKRYRQAKEEGKVCRLVVIGKKGQSFFRFANIEVDEAHTDLDERVSYDRACEIVDGLISSFEEGETDQVEVHANRVKSSAITYLDSTRLLPLDLEKEAVDAATATEMATDHGVRPHYLFSPEPAEILDSLVPMAVKTAFFKNIIESMAAELIARRLAMKNASDAASDMVRDLSRLYNRSRQAAITQEIAEIVGGVEALK